MIGLINKAGIENRKKAVDTLLSDMQAVLDEKNKELEGKVIRLAEFEAMNYFIHNDQNFEYLDKYKIYFDDDFKEKAFEEDYNSISNDCDVLDEKIKEIKNELERLKIICNLFLGVLV